MRIIRTLTLLTLLTAGTYFGVNYGKEYYKIKMGQTCSERMWLIEMAKEKFKKANPGKQPQLYIDLLPHLPFTGFPMCPWGGNYTNTLSLNKQVECSLNGNPNYEPNTPHLDPKKNGYMDLHQKRKAVTFFEFMYEKITWQNTEKDPLKKQKEKYKDIFDN